MKTKQTFLAVAIFMAIHGTAIAAPQDAAVAQIKSQIASASPSSETSSLGLVAPKDAVATVTNIDFKRSPDGGGQLIVEFDRPLSIADVKRDDAGTFVVVMSNTQVPASLLNPIYVADYGTPVKDITIENNPRSDSGMAQATIRLHTKSETKFPALYQAGTKYILDIPAVQTSLLLSGATTDKPSLSVSEPVEAKNAFAGYVPDTRVVGSGQKAMSQASAVNMARNSPPSRSSAPVYSGKPVTFNFQDVPVRTVLQLIAEEAKINIVAADTVDGNVTLKLDAVPWDQALDTILRAKSLDKRRQGSVVWVAPQKEIASYEQAKEDARIALDNRADLATEYIQINYHNAEAIYKAVTEAKGVGGGNASDAPASETGFLSPRGRLIVDSRTNTLMISDIPRKIEQLKELVQVIDRPVDQVLIEARVVVASENYARELGGRFGITGVTNNGRNFIGNSIETNSANNNALVNSINSGSNPTFIKSPMSNTGVINPLGSAALSFLRGGFNLDLELSAMQRDGKGEVVSNPRLVTTNQREAVISQGKEVGYVTISNSQGSIPTPNVQFKDVLLEMKVTPTITNDGRVFLDMNVKKDDIDGFTDTSIGQVPQISKRQINTAVLVEDGQTVVVGGVYEFSDTNSVSKVPFLGDVPFLGNFFKKKGKTKEKAELLIFVTPKVLQVSQPAKMVQAILPRQGSK
mgnify:CR=1 FL=1